MAMLTHSLIPKEVMKTFPGWHQLSLLEKMQVGDVAVFFKSGGAIPNPADIDTYAWNGESGLIIKSWAKQSAYYVSCMPYKKPFMCYAVLRNGPSHKRPYKPSKWADPLPLP